MVCNINQKLNEISNIVKNENYESKFSYGHTEDTIYHKLEITIFKPEECEEILNDWL